MFEETISALRKTLSEAWYLYMPSEPLIFPTLRFALLFLLCYGVFLLVRKKYVLRTLWLLAFSLYFYYLTSGWHILLLVGSSVGNFLLGQAIHKAESKKGKRWFLVASVVLNLGLLAFFKYTGFFIENANALFDAGLSFKALALPVGISFFTFQAMSYTIDLYRDDMKPAETYFDFAFFLSFFPQLVAGPIVRAADFIPQIRNPITLNRHHLHRAFLLIAGGLFKKAVLSDLVSHYLVDAVFTNPQAYSGVESLFSVYGYALQIYCDFSGYSDMAIGLSLLLGFHLPDNFNRPYQSASITEFWRRWHISLSTWLRDYLYIPLGGNRKGTLNTYRNLMITMLLGGLWHGASWNFVAWGGFHGLVLSIERFLGIGKGQSRPWLRWIGVLITFHLVCISWVFFRATEWQHAFILFENIARFFTAPTDWVTFWQAYKGVMFVLVLGFLLHFLPRPYRSKRLEAISVRMPWPIYALLFAALFALLATVKPEGVQPFIYFQF